MQCTACKVRLQVGVWAEPSANRQARYAWGVRVIYEPIRKRILFQVALCSAKGKARECAGRTMRIPCSSSQPHKINRACQAQNPTGAAIAQPNTARHNQEQAYACRLINHDMQHFNIRFAHALASKAGNTANGFFHIALYNTLARRKNLALHGQVVCSDSGIHCR